MPNDGEFLLDDDGLILHEGDGGEFDVCEDCCAITDCPTTCDSCGNKTITLSGFTQPCYTRLNGVVVNATRLSPTFPCNWSGMGVNEFDDDEIVSGTIGCSNVGGVNVWYLTVSGSVDPDNSDGCAAFVTITGSQTLAGCPDGTYSVTATGGAGSDTGTAVVA